MVIECEVTGNWTKTNHSCKGMSVCVIVWYTLSLSYQETTFTFRIRRRLHRKSINGIKGMQVIL